MQLMDLAELRMHTDKMIGITQAGQGDALKK